MTVKPNDEAKAAASSTFPDKVGTITEGICDSVGDTDGNALPDSVGDTDGDVVGDEEDVGEVEVPDTRGK